MGGSMRKKTETATGCTKEDAVILMNLTSAMDFYMMGTVDKELPLSALVITYHRLRGEA